MSRPRMFRLLLIKHARGSMARSNRRQDKGLPCLTPLVTRNGSLSMPFIAIWVWANLYSSLTVLMKGGGMQKVSRTFHR